MSDRTLAVVIPTHNRRATLLRCLHSVHHGASAASAVYVVDDGCQDGTADAVRSEYPAVDLIVGDGSLWWSGAMNLGARTAIRDGAKWILVLNDDTEIAPDAVTHLIRRSEANPDAIVGSKVLTRQTGTIWSGIVWIEPSRSSLRQLRFTRVMWSLESNGHASA